MEWIDSTGDKFLPSEIKNKINATFIGREIVYYEKTDSTNRIAVDLANNGAIEGTLIITDEQTKGRGRLNRSWISEPYKNILMSLILRPSIPVNMTFYLTMIASIALVKTIKQTADLKTLIKWPNDIYCNNKKLAGILTELNINQNKFNYAIIGIGLNVNSDLTSITDIKNTATSIAMECGREISRTILLSRILDNIEEEYILLEQNQFKKLREQWEKHSLIIGKQVIVSSGDDFETGIAKSIAENGSLVFIDAKNQEKNIIAGDISLRLAE